MAFAWHKLYPPESIVSVYVFECNTTPCTCWIPPNHCPIPSELGGCGCYTEIKCRPLDPGETCVPVEGLFLCDIPGQVCEVIWTCYDVSFDCIPTPLGGQTEIDCCRGPICVWGQWTRGAGFQIISNCVVTGTDYGPTTYKIDLGTSGGYAVSRGGTTGSYSIRNVSDPGYSLHFGDPDLIPSDGEGLRNIRYWKNPMGMTGTDGANGRGLTAGFQAMCLKTRSTSSQQSNSTANRIMCISGRNVYNYTGVLSGDPMYGRADSFWDDAGGSGLSQMEGSLGRRFPLADSYLTLPLWGQQTAGGEYTVSSYYGGGCNNPYTGCWGCDCPGPTALGGNVSGSGHFSPDDGLLLGTTAGATGGYFSFGSFNPQSYLDNYNFTQNKIIPRTIGQKNDRDNPLMFPYFGSLGSITGGTSHGPRLGVPTCSVWSLMHAVYRRIYTSLIHHTEANGGVGPSLYSLNAPTEAEFRATYKGSANGLTGMATRFDDWRVSDPSSYTHGQSNAHHYLNKFALAVAQDTKNAGPAETPGSEWGDGAGRGIQFIPPNVFLWDEAAYRAASGANKWKHLFVIGNANVVYDGGCKSIKTGMTGTNVVGTSVTGQNHKSHIFYLDDITNSINAGTLTGFNGYTGGIAMGGEEARHVTPTSNHARIFVFKGCNDATGGNQQTPIASVANRRLSTAQIQLDMLPYYGQIFPGSPCTNDTYSICDICNTFPEYPCFGASEPRSCTGQVCDPGESNIIGTGCFPNQIEQRRISNHKSF